MYESLSEFDLTLDQLEYIERWGEEPIDLISSQLMLLICPDEEDDDLTRRLVIPTEILLGSLNLDGVESDQKSLLNRMIRSRNENPRLPHREPIRLSTKLNTLYNLIDIISQRLENGYTPSVSQEVVLENLAMIIDRQLVREGNTCPLAAGIALRILQHRPGYISDKAIDVMASPDLLRRIPFKHEEFKVLDELTAAEYSKILLLVQESRGLEVKQFINALASIVGVPIALFLVGSNIIKPDETVFTMGTLSGVLASLLVVNQIHLLEASGKVNKSLSTLFTKLRSHYKWVRRRGIILGGFVISEKSAV